MTRLMVTILLGLFAFCFQNTVAQSKSEKERTSFISNTKLLERKPFDPNASVARERGFKWLVETKDVSVTLCTETMKLIPEKKNKFKSELLMQFTFGTAVFKLENPDKKDDEVASTVAGLESVLRTYEIMIAEDEKAKNADLDALLAKRGKGELKAVVEAASCKTDKK